MTTNDLATATTLKKEIDSITSAQALIAATGARAIITIVKADGGTSLNHADLANALGTPAYDTECSDALSALSAALASAKTAAQSALTAL